MSKLQNFEFSKTQTSNIQKSVSRIAKNTMFQDVPRIGLDSVQALWYEKMNKYGGFKNPETMDLKQ